MQDLFMFQENYYLLDFYDSVLADIGLVTNIDFSLKNRTLQDIKKFQEQQKNKQKDNNSWKKNTHIKSLI